MEYAVRWRVFNKTVQQVKSKNAGVDPDHLQEIVDEALGEVRSERRTTEHTPKS